MDRCGPYGCDSGDASWIVVIGDSQVQYIDAANATEHMHPSVVGFIEAHRDRIAGVLFVGDQQGGGGSDGLADGPNQTASAADLLDEAYFTRKFFQPILDAGIPVVASKGNHDRFGSFSLTWDADYITEMKAIPTVLDAELSTAFEDHMVVVVDNFLGGQLLLFGMAWGDYRDDYANCGPDPNDPMTCAGESFWSVPDDANWVNEWLDAYPTAHAAMAIHSGSLPAFVSDDSQFVLYAVGHTINADDAEVNTGGAHNVVTVNHNTQWYGLNGQREITVLRFDPDNGKVYVEQVDTWGYSVRDLVQWDGAVSGYKDGSATLDYTHIADANQVDSPATIVTPTVPTSGGWLDDDACIYAYFQGDLSNTNGCNNDPNFHLAWGSNVGDDWRNGFWSRSWDQPRGSLANSFIPGGQRVWEANDSLVSTHQVLVKDTTDPNTWSPGYFDGFTDLMFCHWLQSKYPTNAAHEAQRAIGGISNTSHTLEWSNEIEAYGVSDATPPYWRYQFGDATSTYYGWFHDGLWHHECFAWGSSDPNSGGTGGDVLMWRDGVLLVPDVEVNSTNALADPVGDFHVVAGDADGWHGWWYENVMLNLANSGSTALSDLTEIVNYIRLCGVADNATSAYRKAAHGGDATVLGPSGETACTN